MALPSGVRFLPGPVNGAVYGRVLVYGDTGGRVREASHVFTHARRDVVWAGTALVVGSGCAGAGALAV